MLRRLMVSYILSSWVPSSPNMTYLLSLAQSPPHPITSRPAPGHHRHICCGWLLSIKPGTRHDPTPRPGLETLTHGRIWICKMIVRCTMINYRCRQTFKDTNQDLSIPFHPLNTAAKDRGLLPVMNMLISGNKRRRIPDYYSAPQNFLPVLSNS